MLVEVIVSLTTLAVSELSFKVSFIPERSYALAPDNALSTNAQIKSFRTIINLIIFVRMEKG